MFIWEFQDPKFLKVLHYVKTWSNCFCGDISWNGPEDFRPDGNGTSSGRNYTGTMWASFENWAATHVGCNIVLPRPGNSPY